MMEYVSTLISLAALVVSVLAYRRVSSIKRSDLRLEARKANAQLHEEVDKLPALLDSARRSREAVDAATGLHNSGAAQRWLTGWDADSRQHASIVTSLPKADATFMKLDAVELEAIVVKLHRLSHQTASLSDNLTAGLASDDERRSTLRAQRLRAPQ